MLSVLYRAISWRFCSSLVDNGFPRIQTLRLGSAGTTVTIQSSMSTEVRNFSMQKGEVQSFNETLKKILGLSEHIPRPLRILRLPNTIASEICRINDGVFFVDLRQIKASRFVNITWKTDVGRTKVVMPFELAIDLTKAMDDFVRCGNFNEVELKRPVVYKAMFT